MLIDSVNKIASQKIIEIRLYLEDKTARYNKRVSVRSEKLFYDKSTEYCIELIVSANTHLDDYGLVMMAKVEALDSEVKFSLELSKGYGPILEESEMIINDEASLKDANIGDAMVEICDNAITALAEYF